MIATVESVMKHPVVTAKPEESLGRVASRMEQFGIGGLPVLEEGKLVGIISSRDIRRSNPNRIVADAMTVNLVTVEKGTSLWKAFCLLEERHLERLPVLDEEKLIGIITKADLLIELGKHIDQLTGLQTGGFFRSVGEALLNEGREIIVLFFDLNDFGEFNKIHGHVIGDECLKSLGHVLSDLIVPEIDYLCRYGGDEFAVLTNRTKEEAIDWVELALNTMKRGLEKHGYEIEASVGMVSGCLRPGQKDHAAALLDDLINSASLASTRAKREGRPLLVAG